MVNDIMNIMLEFISDDNDMEYIISESHHDDDNIINIHQLS